MKNASHVYAIIRYDEFLEEFGPKSKVTVKEIVWTLEKAESEVERLNKLNGDKGCLYFWQMTRLVHHDDA